MGFFSSREVHSQKEESKTFSDTEVCLDDIKITITNDGFLTFFKKDLRNLKIPLRHIETVTAEAEYIQLGERMTVSLNIFGRGVLLGAQAFDIKYENEAYELQNWILNKIEK